jgi:hypothetical protein
MPESSTLRKSSLGSGVPSGSASLHVRKRYLQRRSQRRRLSQRGLTALWLLAGAVVSWLFVVGFAALGH